MGNDHSRNASLKSKVSHTMQKRKSSKLQKAKLKHEKFFTSLHFAQQQQQQNGRINLSTAHYGLQKRVVFVSLMGLYQSWFTCPSQILYSSIFILPLKKEWIYQKNRSYQHEFGRVLQDTDFIKLLKWKDAQGLVFWMKDSIVLDVLDELESHNYNKNISALIDPFWRYLSIKLSLLYDPINGKNYNSLLLNDQWWSTQYKLQESQYNTSYIDIKKELYYVTMKFKTISEILYQSNPSLNIVTVFTNDDIILNNVQQTLTQDHEQNNPQTEANEHSVKSKSFTNVSNQKLTELMEQVNEDTNNRENNEFIVDDNAITPDVDDGENSVDNVWWVSAEYDDDDDDDTYNENSNNNHTA